MNAVGPVTLIAIGIYLGYLTLTGRAANFVAFVTSGGTKLGPGSSGGNVSGAKGPDSTKVPNLNGTTGNGESFGGDFGVPTTAGYQGW